VVTDRARFVRRPLAHPPLRARTFSGAWAALPYWNGSPRAGKSPVRRVAGGRGAASDSARPGGRGWLAGGSEASSWSMAPVRRGMRCGAWACAGHEVRAGKW